MVSTHLNTVSSISYLQVQQVSGMVTNHTNINIVEMKISFVCIAICKNLFLYISMSDAKGGAN